MHRRHGCQCPWNAGQAAAMAAWFTVLAGCYALFIPVIQEPTAQAVVAVLYSVAAIAVTGTYFVVSLTDPSDEGCPGGASESPLYCDQCQRYVQRGSKHCKECLKCILGFDHHCKWVNNCIGSKNYRPFLALLTSMCSMLAVQLGCGVHLVVACFTDPATTAARLAAAYPAHMGVRAYAPALLVYLAVAAAALYPLADLWLLHMVLACRGITTWDYIMANRDASVEPSALSRSVARVCRNFRSWGPRSARIRDESGFGSIASSSSSSGGGGSVPGAHQHPKHKVGINPCLACQTDLSKVPAGSSRQGAYDHFFSSRSGARPEGFDAALIFTPREHEQRAMLCQQQGNNPSLRST